MEVNIHHAKTNLSRLILQAEAGEEVIIARAGKPAVRLVPVKAAKPRKFKAGALKGRLFVPDNFLDRDPELEAWFNDGPAFPESILRREVKANSKTDGGYKRGKVASPSRRASAVVAKRTRTAQ
jgi:prevent-host-death family protein